MVRTIWSSAANSIHNTTTHHHTLTNEELRAATANAESWHSALCDTLRMRELVIITLEHMIARLEENLEREDQRAALGTPRSTDCSAPYLRSRGPGVSLLTAAIVAHLQAERSE